MRIGPREDASIFLHLDEKGGFRTEVLEAGRRVPRAPAPGEIDEAAQLLSRRNPGWGRGLREWLSVRLDLTSLEYAIAAEVAARQSDAEGLLGDLAEAYRYERRTVELEESEARRRNTVFLGLFGWQRGGFSGYSWSFPFHVERYDRSEGLREVAIFPLLSGVRVEEGGGEALIGPLLAYFGSVESPVDRSGGVILFGSGRHYRVAIGGRTDRIFVLPLFSHRSDARGHETMLWPLLGFGWGSEDGRGYVRLFYFLRI